MTRPYRARRVSHAEPARLKHGAKPVVWRIVEGALADLMQSHPEYFTPAGHKLALRSGTKRVAGQVAAYIDSLRKQGEPSDTATCTGDVPGKGASSPPRRSPTAGPAPRFAPPGGTINEGSEE